MCGTCHLFGIFLSNEPMMEETPKMAGICLKVFIRNKAAASFPLFFTYLLAHMICHLNLNLSI